LKIGRPARHRTALGILYAFSGTIFGTVIVFLAARLFGYSLVKSFVSPKKLKKWDCKENCVNLLERVG
jgi:uncharacterized membrane protein YdjX (TVP38/TMEM64 family)